MDKVKTSKLYNEKKSYGEARVLAIFFGIVFLLLFISFLGYKRSLVNTNFSNFSSRLSDIDNLIVILGKKKGDVTQLLQDFRKKIRQSKNDIKRVKLRCYISTFRAAMDNKEIYNSLKLIAQKIGYIEKLEIMERGLADGLLELDYHKQKTTVDLKLINILDPDELVELSNDIKKVINRYESISKDPILNSSITESPTEEYVWNLIYKQEG